MVLLGAVQAPQCMPLSPCTGRDVQGLSTAGTVDSHG